LTWVLLQTVPWSWCGRYKVQWIYKSRKSRRSKYFYWSLSHVFYHSAIIYSAMNELCSLTHCTIKVRNGWPTEDICKI
jgi:hypothetical protein